MLLDKGVDGFFVEYPQNSYKWFTDQGSSSILKIQNPSHILEAEDINLEMTKVCIADRYKHECMSYETLFGGAARTNAFLAP